MDSPFGPLARPRLAPRIWTFISRFLEDQRFCMPASSTWLRRLSFLALLLILLLSSFAAPALAQTNITVANPSFETPVIPNTIEVENGYTMASAHLPTYWTISDYAGIGLAEYFNKDAAGHGQIAPAGTQVGYVQSYLGNGSYMQQTLTGLQSGQSYYITVAAAQRSTNTGSLLMPVQVSLGAQTYQFTPSSSQYTRLHVRTIHWQRRRPDPALRRSHAVFFRRCCGDVRQRARRLGVWGICRGSQRSHSQLQF
jgi:hypothetical protein